MSECENCGGTEIRYCEKHGSDQCAACGYHEKPIK